MEYCDLTKTLIFIWICGCGIQAGSLDLGYVVGRWYLRYADEATVTAFAANTSCVIADASRTGETTLNVSISLQQNATNVTFDGFVIHNGVPYINFTAVNISEIDDVIKIADLDPLTSMYDYLVLQSRPKMTGDIRHLYVLCSSANADHAEEIFEFLQQDRIAEPTSIVQGEQCLYPFSSVQNMSTEAPITTTEVPRVGPIPDLNLNNLLGRWYQVLTNENTRTANALLGMSSNAVCNIATFCQITDRSMSIYEQHWIGTPRGAEESRTGKAVQLTEAGLFNVTMQDIPRGIEWIVKVGDTSSSGEGEGQYSYVVVTDPSLQHLIAFARNMQDFQDNDEVDVIAWLLTAGFTGDDTKPQIVVHDSTCPQPAAPSSLVYPASGCLPESGSSNSYLVPFIVIAILAGFILVGVASYYRSKRPRHSSTNNYGRL